MTAPDNVYYVCRSYNNNPARHEYESIQRAIDAMVDYDKAMIMLEDDFIGIPELMMSHRSLNITINGSDQFGVTFTGHMIVKLGKTNFLKFRNMTYLRGEEIALADEGANVGFYNVQSAVCFFNLLPMRYTNVYIHNTKLWGFDRHAAIEITNPEVSVEVFNSFIKGSVDNPAILFRTESSRKLKMKSSVVLHGTDGPPIAVGSSLFVDVYIYDCFSNENIVNNPINNLIVNNNNNIADENIIF